MGSGYVTNHEFLGDHGFGNAPLPPERYEEYPDLDTQLQTLRRLAPDSTHIQWVEIFLDRARAARGDGPKERAELLSAHDRIQMAFRDLTPKGQWPAMAKVLAVLALLGIALWWWNHRQERNASRDALPQPLDDELASDPEEYAMAGEEHE